MSSGRAMTSTLDIAVRLVRAYESPHAPLPRDHVIKAAAAELVRLHGHVRELQARRPSGAWIDTGDTVFHRPSRETWQVAMVFGRWLHPCGWPDTTADLRDCLLVERASGAERRRLLAEMADSVSLDPHAEYARARLRREIDR